MADPAQEAAREVGRVGKFFQNLPGNIGRAALDPSAYFVPSTLTTAMGKSATAAFIGKSVGEALGIEYGSGATVSSIGTSQGFLGAQKWAEAIRVAKAGQGGAIRAVGGAVFSSALGMASLYFTASDTYSGYQDNGLVGAATGFGQGVLATMVGRKAVIPLGLSIGGASWGGAKAGWDVARGMHSIKGAGTFLRTAAGLAGGGLGGAAGLLFHPATLLIGAGVYGYGELQEYIQKNDSAIARNKQVRGLELGAPIQDPFGTISTLRQRSLQAIQNTHVNGRMAFGNEAALLHSTF